MGKKKEINKKDIIIKIVLIVIIIILLIHNCCVLKKHNKELIPTGNVNIIEIICDKDDVCIPEGEQDDVSSNNHTDNKSNGINYNNSGNNNTSSTENNTIEPEETELLVKDKKVNWEETTQAKIFTNSMYELNDKIAPESSNTYQFIVKNGTNYPINYNINFIETNVYNINMKYKLKKNDTYLIDHYVSASELNQTDLTLNSKKNDTYYLEWKWISSDNDTQIGEASNANYELKIEVKAESNDD